MNTSSHANPDDGWIVLTDPGELVAAIPPILGFHPTDSLVVIGLQGSDAPSIQLMMRADLPDPTEYIALATQLVHPLRINQVDKVVLVVIGGQESDEQELPHRALLAECDSHFTEAGIAFAMRLWATNTGPGQQWRSYEHSDRTGVVPDQRSSVLAAVSVAAGIVTHEVRNDLVATLAPASDDILARRADLLANAGKEEKTGADLLATVTEAIGQAVEDVFPESDEDIVALGFAITDHMVRDACFAPADEAEALAAERLWTCLVRGLPAPERAEAACLLAFSAYLRGDGVLTGIALEIAKEADPDHHLAELLHGAIWTGLPPDRMRKAGTQARAHSRRDLGYPQPDSSSQA